MSGDDRSIRKVCGSLSVWYLGDAVVSGEVVEFVEANPQLVKEIECLRCERKPIASAGCVFCAPRRSQLQSDLSRVLCSRLSPIP